MAKIATVQITSHADEVLAAMREQVKLGLEAIGQEAEGYAKDDCPVGTPESTGIAGYIGGRLRNSITWAVGDNQGEANTSDGANASAEDYKKHGSPKENEMYLGTNVEYAPYVEYGEYKHTTGKNHFLRDAVTNHSEHYKAIMEAALKS